MKSLQLTIDGLNSDGGADVTLRKHLEAVGIREWEDITRSRLYDLKDHLAETLAPNSQKTVMANFKSIIKRVLDEVPIPADYDKILAVKGNKPLKTYLSEMDLKKLEATQARTYNQEFVKNVFLICSYTGLRVGDATNLTSENVVGDSLHYVAQKTHKPGAIPLKPCVAERIKWLSEHQDAKCSRTYYNRAIKRLCKRAGLTDDVVVLKGGKERRGPKWMFVSSHTARISTATCLDRRGVAIGDICQLLQHSSVTTTERYIVRDHIELSEEAMKFFE